jgi:dephospho-CoA kinase
MNTLGLIGGIASGKSRVAEELVRLGAVRIDADRFGHQALAAPEVQSALRRRWGSAVFHPDGSVDRPAVARLVFAPGPAGAAELAFLEAQTHPLIESLVVAELTRCRRDGRPLVVLDAPVLLKAGWDRWCDLLVFIDAPRDVRLARAAARGWGPDELDRREALQTPLDEKRRRATLVIDNSGSEAALVDQVRALAGRLGLDRTAAPSTPAPA